MAGRFSTPKLPPMAAGQRYGRLVSIKFVERVRRGSVMWLFRCDCGSEKVANVYRVRTGGTQSCGCLHADRNVEKGKAMSKPGRDLPEYEIWQGMRQRCRQQGTFKSRNHGDRGIQVCDRWEAFENFYADMGARPSPAHSIDRVDNDGDYGPGNVRWTTATVQANNRRSSRPLTYRGETAPMTEWAQRTGINISTIFKRLEVGWSVERALTTPPAPRGRRRTVA